MRHMRSRLPARFDEGDLRTALGKWQRDCGLRVMNRRQLLNVNRRDLADLCGTTEPTICRIEAGAINPRDILRFAIAGVLRCEVADLWPYPSCERIHDFAQAVA